MKYNKEQHYTGLHKLDFARAALIGELWFVLLFFIFYNLGTTGPFGLSKESFTSSGVYVFLALIFPITTCVGLFIAKLGAQYFRELVRIAKFALVGTLNTLLDIGTFTILVSFFGGVSLVLPIIKITSFLVANTNSYLWNKYWVFPHSDEKKRITSKEISLFFSVSVVGLMVNVVAFVLFDLLIKEATVVPFFIGSVLAALLAALTSLVWNFRGYKFFVFK